MTAAAIIPARGGSTRIPLKNIKEFHGKPIIAYSIEAAQEWGGFRTILVSTDSEAIADVARQYGAEVHYRSENMARDSVGTAEVVRDALSVVKFRHICCIYPCAPFITSKDLDWGRVQMMQRGIEYAFSVGDRPLHDAAQWYWGERTAWRDRAPLIAERTIMVPIPSHRVCDINTPEDWERAEHLFAAWDGKP